MNILITGATGFIGSHLTATLVAKGHRVTCFARRTSDLRWIQHLPVLYRYDLRELSQYNVIYHLAGVLGKKNLPLSTYREPHIEMTKRIIDNINERTKLVYMSSAWVNLPNKPYEYTKLEGERLLRENDVAIRPGFVYGPRDFHHLLLFQWIKRLKRLFPIVGSGKNRVCPTYIKDVIDTLVEAPSLNRVIPVSGKPVTMNEFISAIADALKVSKPFIHTPFDLGPRRDFFVTERAFPNAGKQTALEEGLRTTVDWYIQHNLL